MNVPTTCSAESSELACNDNSAGTAQSQVEFFAEEGAGSLASIDGESFGSYSATMYVGAYEQTR